MNVHALPSEIDFLEDKLVLIGLSSTPHGIKGQVSAVLFSGDQSVLKKGAVIYVRPKEMKQSWKQLKPYLNNESDTYALKVSFLQHTPKKTILGLTEIADRTLLESLGGFGLYFPRKLFPKCRSGEFYWSELYDLTVMSVDEGTVVGKVADVYDNGAQTVLKMALDDDSELDLPFIDEFFPTIDLAKKMIWLRMPEMI
jgi:16S rRNA processing protein RimM